MPTVTAPSITTPTLPIYSHRVEISGSPYSTATSGVFYTLDDTTPTSANGMEFDQPIVFDTTIFCVQKSYTSEGGGLNDIQKSYSKSASVAYSGVCGATSSGNGIRNFVWVSGDDFSHLLEGMTIDIGPLGACPVDHVSSSTDIYVDLGIGLGLGIGNYAFSYTATQANDIQAVKDFNGIVSKVLAS